MDKFTGLNDLNFFPFMESKMSFGASLWDYYIEFWKLRHQENVLIICYEDLLASTERFLPLIAHFIGIPPLDEEQLAKVLYMSSKDFMRKHKCKFDESWVNKKLIEMGRHLEPNQFPASERVVEEELVNQTVIKYLHDKWVELMTKETGFKTYEEFREGISKITEERFAAMKRVTVL